MSIVVSDKFENEKGNRIKINISESDEQVLISISGPFSISENTVTQVEFFKLFDAMKKFRNDYMIKNHVFKCWKCGVNDETVHLAGWDKTLCDNCAKLDT